jgi:peroxiredoxin
MTRQSLPRILLPTLCLLLAACGAATPPETSQPASAPAAPAASAAPTAATQPGWPQSERDVSPLLLGNPLPDVTLRTLDDATVSLKDAIGGKPAVLVFYRGGWCPYCNLQLSGLRLIHKDLETEGYALIAISPDSPAELRKSLDKTALDYQLLSDSDAHAMRAFGIGYQVDANTREKLSGFGIDLAKASGRDHHVLPVPAVYLVDEDGVLQFSHVHPDYTVRLPQDVVLAAARAIRKGSHRVKRE